MAHLVNLTFFENTKFGRECRFRAFLLTSSDISIWEEFIGFQATFSAFLEHFWILRSDPKVPRILKSNVKAHS